MSAPSLTAAEYGARRAAHGYGVSIESLTYAINCGIVAPLAPVRRYPIEHGAGVECAASWPDWQACLAGAASVQS